MMLVTKYDIGDYVTVGPHEGRVTAIMIAQQAVYQVTYWIEGMPESYQAMDWELTLVRSAVDA